MAEILEHPDRNYLRRNVCLGCGEFLRRNLCYRSGDFETCEQQLEDNRFTDADDALASLVSAKSIPWERIGRHGPSS